MISKRYLDNKYIISNHQLRIVLGWLYAVGDSNGRAIMTHTTQYQAKLAGGSIVAKAPQAWDKLTAKPTGLAIPQCVFTDPQVAACGLTPEQAKARGIKTRVISASMSGPGVWLHADGYQGWAQWVIDDTNRLIRATFVGRDAVDLLQASTMAGGRLTLDL
jgi:pyruvate/2-oxoglutarate dehydrogenase complex dihydrolipoamide dehydrogenase (E3) component